MNSTMNNNMMMKAFTAMTSGQNPRQFLMEMAKSMPQLQGIDFNNLQQTAQNLCNQKGVNMNDAIKQINGFANQFK